MDLSKIYMVRKAILRELKYAEAAGKANPAPMSVDMLVQDRPNPSLMYAPEQMIREQWAELKNYGYIVSIEGYEGAFCKLSDKGRQQLSIEFDQDYFIHGPSAIRSR